MTRETPTLTDRVRQLTHKLAARMGEGIYRRGVHPDVVTIMGLVLVGLAALLIARGQFQIGALILLVGLPFDFLDGAVARAMQREDKFGAVLDSTLDRYADGFIFIALSYYFAVEDRFLMMLLTMAALLGSLLVSYIRARADGVQITTKIGIFTRMERVLVIILMLLFPVLLDWGIWLLAFGTNFTAMQRLWFVYSNLKNKGG